MDNTSTIKFRFATDTDTQLILDFIHDLARYEKMDHLVVADYDTLHEQLFIKHNAEVLFVMKDDIEVGFALFFHNFSTFLGKAGLYLEDLYVKPEYRGQGIGKRMFRQLGRICQERSYGRFEWWCLNWNEPSIQFYKSMGAEAMSDWTVFRIDGETLKGLK
ncbi:MAG: GNAT family N-acetyltransferase [Bacteroidales bacterium]|nr:GNAT family N-acetyltransferase [Candidatus Colimorpha onthohippi]